MTLRRRLALGSAVTVALTIAIAAVAIFFTVRSQVQDQLDDSLTRLAKGATLTPLSAGRAEATTATVGQLRATKPTRATNAVAVGAGAGAGATRLEPAGRLEPSNVAVTLPAPSFADSAGYAQVVNTRGDVVKSEPGKSALVAGRKAEAVAAGKIGSFFSEQTVNGTKVRVLTTQRAPGEAIQVARSTDEADTTLKRLGIVLVIVALAGIGIAALIGRLISGRAIAPVAELTETTEHVARTRDLGARIETRSDDELGRLAVSFNTMLQALEESDRSQRRLVGDVTHELRTPLTSLRANAEVLAGLGEGVDPAESRRIAADIAVEARELSGLVSGLVDLERGEEAALELRPLRLDELIEESVDRATRRWPSVRFVTELDASEVSADPERLPIAVGNLLDNAAKWSEPGGEITVRLAGGRIEVRDRGPGVAEADRPFVFERFYRAADARDTPGAGLGLAIVEQIATSHGGTAEVAAAEGGGACFALSLPVLGVPSRTS